MKWFFYALLLTNLALFGWLWQRPQPVTAGTSFATGYAQGPHTLVLLREMKSRSSRPDMRSNGTGVVPPNVMPDSGPAQDTAAAASVTVAEAPKAETPKAETPKAETPKAETPKAETPKAETPKAESVERGMVCHRIGALESEQKASELGQRLARAGASLRGQGSEAGTSSRYWVTLPRFKSSKAAAAMLERLRKAGVKDYYLIRSGENKNAISLGVFSGKESAQRRYQELRNMKFNVQLDEISVAATRWWLEFSWPAASGETWRRALPKTERSVAAAACR